MLRFFDGTRDKKTVPFPVSCNSADDIIKFHNPVDFSHFDLELSEKLVKPINACEFSEVESFVGSLVQEYRLDNRNLPLLVVAISLSDHTKADGPRRALAFDRQMFVAHRDVGGRDACVEYPTIPDGEDTSWAYIL